MTLIHASFALPYGEGGSTALESGQVHFDRAKTSALVEVILTSGRLTVQVTGGVMAPADLAPGPWRVTLCSGGSLWSLGEIVVGDEDSTLILGADGQPQLTTDGLPVLITHISPGVYQAPTPYLVAGSAGQYTIESATISHEGDGLYSITKGAR